MWLFMWLWSYFSCTRLIILLLFAYSTKMSYLISLKSWEKQQHWAPQKVRGPGHLLVPSSDAYHMSFMSQSSSHGVTVIMLHPWDLSRDVTVVIWQSSETVLFVIELFVTLHTDSLKVSMRLQKVYVKCSVCKLHCLLHISTAVVKYAQLCCFHTLVSPYVMCMESLSTVLHNFSLLQLNKLIKLFKLSRLCLLGRP